MSQKEKSVFLQSELSLEEEYDLIFSNIKKEEEKEVRKLIFGNKLLPASENLEPTNFEVKNSQNNLVESILTAFFANPLFFTMIENVEDKINHSKVYTPFLCKLSHYKRFLLSFSDNIRDSEKEQTNESNGSQDSPQKKKHTIKNPFAFDTTVSALGDEPSQIYRSILKKAHLDFVDTHYFEQEDWNSTKKKTYKFDKKLFKEYSPIVEIFHGEYEGTINKQPFKITKDSIQLQPDTFKKEAKGQTKTYASSHLKETVTVEPKRHDSVAINDCIEHALAIENIEISKYPLILVITSNSNHPIKLLDNLQLNKRNYNLNSFITKEENKPVLYSKNKKGEWTTGEKIIEKLSKQDMSLLMAFYQIDKMMQ
ncbi:hypothetical protein M153_1100064646 [Pseudoloma neurophilia]|uniref:Uncharacterized protein n=1 Tax=Pseudoloma neurophilia TaxID=146866 RepID=A0A0R0M873_9MICR|nr:hypothetical protein M153_1100064646 [Pseudoloma neurophilia]